MEDQYLVDKDQLGDFVDKLIKIKFPNENTESVSQIREDGIRELDDEIGKVIFSSLNKSQLEEYNNLLDITDSDPMVFQNFFKNAGIDLEEKISEAVKNFQARFLGGQNV